MVRVIVNSSGGAIAGTGHTNIVASIDGDTAYAFDCGNSDYVKNGDYPNGVNSNHFYKVGDKNGTKRVAKIIRIAP